MALDCIVYSRGSLKVLDQLRLPQELVYSEIRTVEDTWRSIYSMQVRGAPLIAIVAVLGVSVELHTRLSSFIDKQDIFDFIKRQLDYVMTSRPTAVNLFQACRHLKKSTLDAFNDEAATVASIAENFLVQAEKWQEYDVSRNKAIGLHGCESICDYMSKLPNHQQKLRVLTHCNTGSLATGGYGTALGVIRSLFKANRLEHVYFTETRPYNQGSRLTSVELLADAIPCTMIADSMVSALLKSGRVDLAITGADRIASNGDTANKIGTYQIALACQYHDIPFYIAAPSTTIDTSIDSGSQIVIEERNADEMTRICGVKTAPDGIRVWNPSFDVTTADLITGIVTEFGVFYGPDYNLKDMSSFNRFAASSPYVKLSEREAALLAYDVPRLKQILGNPDSVNNLIAKEVGDGNLNLVFIITNNTVNGLGLVIKQALPYVRCVGESWPLSIDRAYFEHEALCFEHDCCPQFVPEVYWFNKSLSVTVMEYLAPPFIILRKALMQCQMLPNVASDLGIFLANTLFCSSGLTIKSTEFRKLVSKWSLNWSMCALSEQVIFTEPYLPNTANNHWTSPELDDVVAHIQSNDDLKSKVSQLKIKFMTQTQALLHGDLHTGSVMVTESRTIVIDPEFAYYGPMGFDVGAILANFIFSFISHKFGEVLNLSYADWVVDQVRILLTTFESTFIQLWNDKGSSGTDWYFSTSVSDQSQFMDSVRRDSFGFAGCKLIRRIIGIAHVADLETISDHAIRSQCEMRCLNAAVWLILEAPRANFGIMQLIDYLISIK